MTCEICGIEMIEHDGVRTLCQKLKETAEELVAVRANLKIFQDLAAVENEKRRIKNAENKLLREGLEGYADPKSWRGGSEIDYARVFGGASDGFKPARDILEKLK